MKSTNETNGTRAPHCRFCKGGVALAPDGMYEGETTFCCLICEVGIEISNDRSPSVYEMNDGDEARMVAVVLARRLRADADSRGRARGATRAALFDAIEALAGGVA